MRYLRFLWLLLLLPTVAHATVTANSIVTAQTPNRGVVQFLTADAAGTYKVLYTGGTNGSRCNAIWLTTNDTATHVVTVQFANQTTVISGITGGRGGLSITTVAAGGTTAFATPINILLSSNWPGLPVDSDGNPYIQLTSADSLQATFATAITASTAVNLVASCSDF